MTPERKQELLNQAQGTAMIDMELNCTCDGQRLRPWSGSATNATPQEMVELLTEKVCEWTLLKFRGYGYTTACGRVVNVKESDGPSSNRPCWCSGKVVTRG